MKRGIYLVVIAIMMAATAMAQQKEQREMPTVEQIAKMKAERMRKQLLLGNEQYEKVYKSCLKETEKQRKRMQQMAKEREEMAKEMKGILNEVSMMLCSFFTREVIIWIGFLPNSAKYSSFMMDNLFSTV